MTYPQSIDAIDNESLDFPVLFKKISKKNLSFIKFDNSMVLEDMLDKIKFEPLENSFYNKIKLPNLSIGVYQLKLKKERITINITVHSG